MCCQNEVTWLLKVHLKQALSPESNETGREETVKASGLFVK